MNETLVHRGPDGSGIHRSGPVGLAMRRLAVIDPDGGRQPMTTADGGWTLVYNGEIYNYRELRQELEGEGACFRTASDTEVLLEGLARRGVEFLQRVNGMFAAALWEARTGQLTLMRDRLGIKPLLYFAGPEGVVFGSEMKAVLAGPWVPRELDPAGLSAYLASGYVTGERTLMAGVRPVPPAHLVRVRPGEPPRPERYWSLPLGQYTLTREEEAVEALRAALDASVQRRLVADVPVGALLSGGLDSGALVEAFTRLARRPVSTFCVGFHEPTYDESQAARVVADHLGADHHTVHFGPEDLPEAARRVACHADNPVSDPALLAVDRAASLAREKVTVVLDGDGGDEVWVGYVTHRASALARIWRRVPGLLSAPLSRVLQASVRPRHTRLSTGYRLQRFLEGARRPPEEAHWSWRTVHARRELDALLTDPGRDLLAGSDPFEAYRQAFDATRNRPDLPFLDRALAADLDTWLVGNNLAKVDSMTMAHSLEARVPFLDHELVELAFRISPRVRMPGGRLKHLLRQALRGRLPDRILRLPKSGFHLPLAPWFAGPLLGFARDTLLGSPLVREGILSREGQEALIAAHVSGRVDASFRIWNLALLALWHQNYL